MARRLRAAGGRAAFTREVIRWELERVRADAAGPEPSPLERVLADRAALGWGKTSAGRAGERAAAGGERAQRQGRRPDAATGAGDPDGQPNAPSSRQRRPERPKSACNTEGSGRAPFS